MAAGVTHQFDPVLILPTLVLQYITPKIYFVEPMDVGEDSRKKKDVKALEPGWGIFTVRSTSILRRLW